jgi:hypothetical protein
MGSFHLSIDYRGKHIEGEALPLNAPKQQGIPLIHKIIIDGKDQGIIRCTKESWAADKIKDQKLVDAIGSYIHAWYEGSMALSRPKITPNISYLKRSCFDLSQMTYSNNSCSFV